MPIPNPGYVPNVANGGALDPDWGNAIRDRTVQVFATTVDRDASVTAPVEGMAAWVTADDTLYVYNGVAWRKPWSQPWGAVARAAVVADQGAITVAADITGATVTWTAVANRLYKVTAQFALANTNASADTLLSVTDAALVIKAQAVFTHSGTAGRSGGQSLAYVESGLAAGSVTRKMRAQALAGTTTSKGTVSPVGLIVEDIGPNGVAA